MIENDDEVIVLTQKYYTTKEACYILGIANSGTIRKYIYMNLLRAKRNQTNEWLITCDSLAEKLIRQGRPAIIRLK